MFSKFMCYSYKAHRYINHSKAPLAALCPCTSCGEPGWCAFNWQCSMAMSALQVMSCTYRKQLGSTWACGFPASSIQARRIRQLNGNPPPTAWFCHRQKVINILFCTTSFAEAWEQPQQSLILLLVLLLYYYYTGFSPLTYAICANTRVLICFAVVTKHFFISLKRWQETDSWSSSSPKHPSYME